MTSPLLLGGTLDAVEAELPLTIPKISRRSWLEQAGAVTGAIPLGYFSPAASWLLQNAAAPAQHAIRPVAGKRAISSQRDPIKYKFTPAEDAFLEEIEKASFRFFWEEANPYTGQVKDRSQADGPDARKTASIAATGFGLTALCIADHRGWEDRKKIRERVRNTLRFAFTRLTHMNGFFFHFLNMDNGDRDFKSEVSSVDTSIFLCGALACGAHFDDAEIRELATKIYERVDWGWILNGGKTLSMGWKPESGFIKSRWDSYSELMMIYLLGLGSPTHPLPKESWDAWERPRFEYYAMKFIGSHAPLFVHQYSHAWFDFRGKTDAYANYFENSVTATKVHKLWCVEMAKQFPDYSDDLWGITASDSAHGYVAWGGPPPMGPIDGSVVPSAAAGSLPFLPEECFRVLRTIRTKYEKRGWKKYGFVDALNPLKDWYNPDVIGIDLGITLLMAENARTGFVWDLFMKNEAAKRGMARAGFRAQ